MRAVGDLLRCLARADNAGDAVLARDDRRVREQSAAVGDDPAEQRQQDVERLRRRLGDEDVSLHDPVKFGRTGDAARGALEHARARAEPAQQMLLVLGLGAAEQLASAIPIARMRRPTAGGSPDGSGGGGGGGPSDRGASFAVCDVR